MKIKATEEQVLKMLALATQASIPMGLGFLHFKLDTKFKPEDFISNLNKQGAFVDYYEGRMVKIYMFRNGDMWEAPDNIRPDYESWITTYPSYKELAEAAGAMVGE